MGKLRKLLLNSGASLLCAVLCCSNILYAQQPKNLEGYLSYPLNKSFVIYDFANNINEINSLHSYITKTLNDPYLNIRSIAITGYSSPEGRYEHNEQLAVQRAESLKSYLLPFFSEQEISINYIPEDWNGLIEILRNVDYPELNKIQAIAESDLSPEQKENKLKKLPSRIYKELNRNYFPQLRKATLTIYCDKNEEPDLTKSANTRHIVVKEENTQDNFTKTQQNNLQYRNSQLYKQNIQNSVLADRYGSSYYGVKKRRTIQSKLFEDTFTPRIAVGTNLLEWAGFRPDFTHTTVIPNIYVEYYFLQRWSAKATFSYCDWSYDNGERFQGISSYSVEPRFWWKNDGKYRGLFFGVYGQLGDYNQRKPSENYTGKYYSGGVSAGYLFPLYKGLALEVNVRAGYRHATVKKYNANEECSDLCRQYNKNEFTITGSFINLLYRF